MVPLLSVLTLAVTIITQTLQQRDQERSRQDTIWRGTIEEFKSATQRNVAFGGLLAQVKLKPFFKSTEYGEQANQLARLVLPRVTDRDAFRDLFDSVEWHDLNEMAAVNRTMNTVYDELNARSAKLTAAESNPEPAPSEHGTKPIPHTPTPVPAARVSPLIPTPGEEIEHEKTELGIQERYVCDRIDEAFRSKALTWEKRPNLESTWFPNCDLSTVDFRDADLTAADFQNVNLEGAQLGQVTKIDNLVLTDTAWWRAKQIGQSLLSGLMNCCDPGSDGQQNIAQKPTKDEYVKQVLQLCKSSGLACIESSIKFTAPKAEQK